MVFGKVSEPWGVGFGWSLSSARVQQFRWWEHSLMMFECLWAMWEWASLFEYPPGRAIYIFCFLLFSPLLTVPVCLLQNSLHTTLVSGALQQTQLSHCRKKWAVVPPKCPLMCPLYYGRFSGRTLLSISGSESVLLSPHSLSGANWTLCWLSLYLSPYAASSSLEISPETSVSST